MKRECDNLINVKAKSGHFSGSAKYGELHWLWSFRVRERERESKREEHHFTEWESSYFCIRKQTHNGRLKGPGFESLEDYNFMPK